MCAIPLQAGSDSPLCRWCEPPHALTPSGERCLRCGEPGDQVCFACERSPIVSGRVISAGLYEGAYEPAIKTYKYQGRRRIAAVLGQRLVDRLRAEVDVSSTAGWDLVVPVPSSLRSLTTRGFHHTLLIAKLLGNAFRVPVSRWALRYRSSPSPQASLLPAARWENVHSMLTAKARIVRGKQLLLVDDVLTTGATLNAADRALLGAGALRVDAITVARSTQLTNYRLQRLADESRSKVRWD